MPLDGTPPLWLTTDMTSTNESFSRDFTDSPAPLRISVSPLFVREDDTYTVDFTFYLESLGVDEWQNHDLQLPDLSGGCECELDWNCYLHRNRLYTAVERINDAWATSERDW